MKALLSKQKMINRVLMLPTEEIYPNPNQPRKHFDEEKIEQLAMSINQYGLLQPVTVLQNPEGGYQLVAGERRLMACKRLKLEMIPAIIVEMNEEKSSALALIENIQRCDLNFFEEASAIQKLMKMMGETQQAVAMRLGKNQSTVANKLRLLHFSPQVRQAILSADLTERHARALLSICDLGDSTLLEKIKVIEARKLNVSQTEELILQMQGKPERKKNKNIFVVKDLRIFMNSIEKAVSTMKMSGIKAETTVAEDEGCFVYTVRIPKTSAYRQKETQKNTEKKPDNEAD